MKIRPGQINGPQQGTSTGRMRTTDSRFQTLLDHELADAVEKQPDIDGSDQHDGHRPYHLISDATRLLDDAIAEIETSEVPNDKTIESLQKLRNELQSLGHGQQELGEAGIILSVETERLKSW